MPLMMIKFFTIKASGGNVACKATSLQRGFSTEEKTEKAFANFEDASGSKAPKSSRNSGKAIINRSAGRPKEWLQDSTATASESTTWVRSRCSTRDREQRRRSTPSTGRLSDLLRSMCATWTRSIPGVSSSGQEIFGALSMTVKWRR